MAWTAQASVGGDRVIFRGEGHNVGTVFRGTVSDEIWAAFRSMTVAPMRRRVRPGWRIETPHAYLSYPNTGDKLRFVVFHSPTTRAPLVLRFDRAVSESLIRDITAAFTPNAVQTKEQNDGSQTRIGQRTEAGRQVQPLPGTASESEQGGDRRGRTSPEDPWRDGEGEQRQAVSSPPAGPWWKKKGKGGRAGTKQQRNVSRSAGS